MSVCRNRRCHFCGEKWLENDGIGGVEEAYRFELTCHSVGVVDTVFLCSAECLGKAVEIAKSFGGALSVPSRGLYPRFDAMPTPEVKA